MATTRFTKNPKIERSVLSCSALEALSFNSFVEPYCLTSSGAPTPSEDAFAVVTGVFGPDNAEYGVLILVGPAQTRMLDKSSTITARGRTQATLSIMIMVGLFIVLPQEIKGGETRDIPLVSI